MTAPIECLVEVGAKRTFAAAAAWPGWCRSARDEADALEALRGLWRALCGGPRRRRTSVRAARRRCASCSSPNVRRATRPPSSGRPTRSSTPTRSRSRARGWTRLRSILEACWTAFDRAATDADGVELRKGPRGGGRELDAIVAHVAGAEASYLRRLTGVTVKVDESDAWASRLVERAAVLDGARPGEGGQASRDRSPRWGDVDAAAVPATGRLARARPRMGDRGPRDRVSRRQGSAGADQAYRAMGSPS